MVDIANLQIQIDSDGIRGAGRELDGLARKGTQVGRQLTTRLTVPLVAGMAGAVREAALLEGAFDKFDVVFRGMNEEMREFVDLYNNEFPISRRETVELAAALQDLLVPMGINREVAAGMTKDWLELAGALSAFNDVPIQQVLEAMRSGIAGMTRPLRRFGIDAREAVLQQVALEEGLIRAGDAMNEQVRQQALLIQATRQSKDAIEGLEEQKGSLLWQIEELKRDTKDLAAVYGQELIPVARKLIENGQDLATWFKNLDEDTQSLIVTSGLVVAAFGPAVGGLSWAFIGATAAASKLNTGIKALYTTMAKHPYLLAAAGVAALGVEIYNTHQQAKTLEEELSGAFSGGLSGIEEANNLIVQIQERIESLKQAGIQSGFMDTEEVLRLQEAMDKVVQIRNELALKQHDAKFFSEDETQDVKEATKAVDELVRSIEGVRVAASKPQDPIIDPVEEARIQKIRQEAEEFNGVLLEILNTDYDWSHRLSMDDVKEDIEETNQVARDLGFTFSSAFEDAIVQGNSFRDVLDGIFQDLLRITTRSLITENLGNSLSTWLSGIDLFGGGGAAENVNDLIITNSGRVFKPHPDDTIMAMKNIDPVFNNKNTTNVSTPVNVTINNQTDSQVDVQESRGAGGEREVEVFVRKAVKGLMNSGQLDRTMRQNYGVRRKGVNYG